VTLLDTGQNTMTGGRILRAKDFIGNEPFMLTYGDGVADVNIAELVKFHKEQGKLVTMTSIQPEGRFGALEIQESKLVTKFHEKPKGDGAWINGGFFVCQPEVLDYITNDSTIFEREPLENLANQDQLITYQHNGFWKCMDTLRDKVQLNEYWESGTPPWRIW
jgi:glucose-1-phosphate cytidylyltransferase